MTAIELSTEDESEHVFPVERPAFEWLKGDFVAAQRQLLQGVHLSVMSERVWAFQMFSVG